MLKLDILSPLKIKENLKNIFEGRFLAVYVDPKRYENDSLYEDEDIEYEYEDEYEADDSDYIVDDEDEEDTDFEKEALLCDVFTQKSYLLKEIVKILILK